MSTTTRLAALTATRGSTFDQAKRLLDNAANSTRELTANERIEYERLLGQLDDIDAQVRDLKENAARHDQSATTVREFLAHEPERPTIDRCWLPSIAEYRELQTDQRAIGTTGAFIPQGHADTFFDQLRKRTSVLAAGPVRLDVERAGSLKVPAVTASVTVGATAEAGAITPSDPTLASITLDPKKFAALTLVNSEAIEDSNPALREVVAKSLIADLAVELDKQLITGSGSGDNLTGLRNIASVTAGPSMGVNGSSLTLDNLADTIAAAEAANLDPDRLAWFMHSRTWGAVRKLKDSQNRPIVAIDPTLGVKPSIFGKPVHLSNNLSIAETQGSNSDCSTMLLVDMSQIVVGVSRDIEVVISTDYAFNTDQVAIRATCRYDIGAPQPTAIVKVTGVRA